MPRIFEMTPRSSMATFPRRSWRSRRVNRPFEASCTQLQPAGDPNPGLVEVDGGRVFQELSRRVKRELEAACCLLNPRGERAGRYFDAEHVELCHAVVGEVLVDHQVASERPDPGPVTRGSAPEGRDLRLGLTSARTSPRSIRCSVTTTRTAGMSKTWRRSIATTSGPDKSASQFVHEDGEWLRISSGSTT